jgi:hypothetical protein
MNNGSLAFHVHDCQLHFVCDITSDTYSRQDIKATQSIIGNGVKTLSYLALVLIADL